MSSSDDGGHPPAAVVPVIVLPGQVWGGHEDKALVRAAVLEENVDALLAGGLPGIGQRRVPMGIACHHVDAVLWKEEACCWKPRCQQSTKIEGKYLRQLGLNVTEDGEEGEETRQDTSLITRAALSHIHKSFYGEGLVCGTTFSTLVFQTGGREFPPSSFPTQSSTFHQLAEDRQKYTF